MHFALPPRKTSQPPPYARASRNPPKYGQRELRLLGYLIGGFLTVFLVFRYASFSSTVLSAVVQPGPPDTPPIVLVTVFDEEHMSKDYIQKVKVNREDYAHRHGQPGFLRLLLRSNC